MTLSRPMLYLLVGAVVIAAALKATEAEPLAKPAPPRKRTVKAGEAGWDFPAQDPRQRFPKPARLTRNPFKPLVASERLATVNEPKIKEDLVQVPSNLADGEGGWAYTGMVEVDGVRMALLQNSGTNLSGYVREGETWKKSRIVGISSPCVVFADEKGVNTTVFRYNPNDPPKAPAPPQGGFMPTGPIGGNLTVRPLTPPPPPNNLARTNAIVRP